MISYVQAIVIGLLQGISELFPVSSLGHSVILPQLLGWDIHQQDRFFLNFLIATHLATALVLLGFFWEDWKKIVLGFVRTVQQRSLKNEPHGRLGWLLVVGTLPAAVIALALESKLRVVFASAQSAAFFLMLNGALLYGSELLRRKAQKHDESDIDLKLSKLGWKKVFGIGLAQSLALIPGFSRSGAAMGGGLLAGLSNEDAARFSFLLATPIIGGAAILKLPELLKAGTGQLGPAFVGAMCAAVSAYFSVKFLVKFFTSNKLTPFAIYCVIAGGLASLLLIFR